MSPVLRYHNGSAWTELPLIGQPGLPGPDGADGPQGPAAVITTDHLVARTGDTMTGPLILPADPTAALEAATKQYVDRVGGNLGSSAIGRFAQTTVNDNTNVASDNNGQYVSIDLVNTQLHGVTFRQVPITLGFNPVPGWSPTGMRDEIVVDRTGYYFVYCLMYLQNAVPPAAGRASANIGHAGNNQRGMASIMHGEQIVSLTANIWCVAGDPIWFRLDYAGNTGAGNVVVPQDVNFIIRCLGESQ